MFFLFLYLMFIYCLLEEPPEEPPDVGIKCVDSMQNVIKLDLARSNFFFFLSKSFSMCAHVCVCFKSAYLKNRKSSLTVYHSWLPFRIQSILCTKSLVLNEGCKGQHTSSFSYSLLHNYTLLFFFLVRINVKLHWKKQITYVS